MNASECGALSATPVAAPVTAAATVTATVSATASESVTGTEVEPGWEKVHCQTMARLVLHDLQSDKRAGELARLIESLAADGHRLVVLVADDGRRQIFDDWLWTFSRLAFVPHALWQASLGEVEEPVVLVGEPGNPNRATILVIGDDLPPKEWARGFDEVHDLIAPGSEGDERRGWWERWRDSESES